MRCLVTGGAGFIGSWVADELQMHDHGVVVIDNLSGGYIENIPDNVCFMAKDLLNYDAVEFVFDTMHFDYVYHFACYAAEGLSHFIRRYNYQNNLLASINLINLSVKYGVKCFVFASSMSVYGKGEFEPPFYETYMPMPEDPYAIAKYAVERDLWVAQEMFGMDYVIIRPHNVYGERQNTADGYRNVVGIFMNRLLKGEPMRIYGDGNQVRAFSYIRDIAPIIAKAPQDLPRNEVYNLGGDKPITINRLSELVSKATGIPCKTKHTSPRFEVKTAFCDHSKIKSIVGDYEQTSYEEALENMADWIKEIGPRNRDFNPEIEVTRKLPEFWR